MLLALIVLSTNLVQIKNVLTPVLELVDKMQNVASEIIVRFAVALLTLLEIPSLDVSLKRVRKFQLYFVLIVKDCFNFDLTEKPVYKESENPCIPSPCGPFSQCRLINSQPVCSCVQNYIGRPPNCRPECMLNSECTSNLACINEKCKDPCPGSCGFNALCNVVNHSPACHCMKGYTGDPFSGCSVLESKILFKYAYFKIIVGLVLVLLVFI